MDLVRHPVWSSYGLPSSALAVGGAPVEWMHYFIKHKVTCTQILCVFLECSDLQGPFSEIRIDDPWIQKKRLMFSIRKLMTFCLGGFQYSLT